MGGRGDVNTCQYGWKADNECNAWGQLSPFHGCKLAEGHYGDCTCLCGAGRRMQDRRGKAVA